MFPGGHVWKAGDLQNLNIRIEKNAAATDLSS